MKNSIKNLIGKEVEVKFNGRGIQTVLVQSINSAGSIILLNADDDIMYVEPETFFYILNNAK